MSELFGKTTDALGAAIQMRLLRQNVITSNVANAETPGYKAKKVDFEEALARAVDVDGKGQLSVSSPDHFPVGSSPISHVRADVYENPDITVTNDGNTVDLEKELAELADNSIAYQAAVQLINKKLAGLAYAATEGGGGR